MVCVMSSQLLWPTTAKTESPRKEPANSLRPLQWCHNPCVPLSNNESLLIGLKISSHTCFQSRGTHRSHSLFGVVRVVFGQPDLSGYQRTSKKINTRARPSSYGWLCCCTRPFQSIMFQPNWRVIKTKIACFTNGVTRELVSSFFGLPSGFYGEKETTLCSVYIYASSRESVKDARCTAATDRDDITVIPWWCWRLPSRTLFVYWNFIHHLDALQGFHCSEHA